MPIDEAQIRSDISAHDERIKNNTKATQDLWEAIDKMRIVLERRWPMIATGSVSCLMFAVGWLGKWVTVLLAAQ